MAPQPELHISIRSEDDSKQAHDVFVVFDRKGLAAPERFPKDQRWLRAKRPQLEARSPAGAAS